jgi:2-polyprenyl-3-methyl-5-hydroxy-6-metoxy-1,4-benzoquinol methylase
MKPYIIAISGDSVPTDGVFAEMDRICALGSGGALSNDVEAYTAIHAYIQSHRQGQPPNPFTLAYFRTQAAEVQAILSDPLPHNVRILDYGCGSGDMLSMFHREYNVASGNLHCIELHDSVPDARKHDFTLHVLKDPIGDLKMLSKGPLKASFDVVSSFAVFHHIPDKEVRATVLSSIALMLKPQAVFLLADWSSFDKPHYDQWYDVAHFLLWLFMGSVPPSSNSNLDIYTRYAGVNTYISLASSVGLHPEEALSSSAQEIDASPLGGFSQVFRLTSAQGSTLASSPSDSAGSKARSDNPTKRQKSEAMRVSVDHGPYSRGHVQQMHLG